MGKATGFMEIDRVERDYEPVEDRIKHFKEFMVPLPPEKVSEQGARCMDCGIPYCHQGCPVNNLIPDWNEMVYSGKWRDASRHYCILLIIFLSLLVEYVQHLVKSSCTLKYY